MESDIDSLRLRCQINNWFGDAAYTCEGSSRDHGAVGILGAGCQKVQDLQDKVLTLSKDELIW